MTRSTPHPAPTDRRSRPPVPLIGPLLEPAYRYAVGSRNRAFDRGRRVTRFDIPIISVGNLSVGGTGKTPTVRMLVQELGSRGRNPAIAMRGYKSAPNALSDEEAEYRDAFPDVPVVAQPDRASGIAELLRTDPSIDCVVLDDGFQHRYVARDLDIVLVDATRSPFRDRCLPAGWLREPVSSIARAGLVLITRSDAGDADALEADLREFRVPIARTTHAWSALSNAEGARSDLENLIDRSVVVCCAIGHPSAFVRQCVDAGAHVEGAFIERDHHHWSPTETARIEDHAHERGALIVTTRKDWVKLRAHARDTARYRVPEVEIRPDEAGVLAIGAALDRVLSSGV